MEHNNILRPFFKKMCLLCSSADHLIGRVGYNRMIFRCHKVLVAIQMQMLILQTRVRRFFMSTLVWVSTVALPVSVGRSANIGECL